jgi:hypothetical protein
MKTLKTFFLFVAGVSLLFTTNSCKKIQEDTFIKGLWKMNGMYFDTLSQNQMENHFDGYGTTANCCYYKLDFQPDNVVFGYYLKENQFKSVVIGSWEIVKYNQIQLQIDSFADGIFDIERTTPKKYKLTSDDNHVKYYDSNPSMDTTITRLELERI